MHCAKRFFINKKNIIVILLGVAFRNIWSSLFRECRDSFGDRLEIRNSRQGEFSVTHLIEIETVGVI